jgi:hypothetical protein
MEAAQDTSAPDQEPSLALVPSPVAPKGRSAGTLVLGLATLALAGVWLALNLSALKAGASVHAEGAVNAAGTLLDQLADETQARLRTSTLLLAQDPRLQSTLATPAVEEPALRDTLQELRKESGAGLLALISPTTQVLASVGQDIKGMDVSNSSVLKAAQGGEPAAGTWVVGERVLDVSATRVVVDGTLAAYLVVGEPLSDAPFKQVYQATGAGVALVLAGKVALAHPQAGRFKAAFEALAQEPASFEAQSLELGGVPVVARYADMRNSAPRARLAVVYPTEDAAAPYGRARALAWVPLAVAVLFAGVALVRGRLLR